VPSAGASAELASTEAGGGSGVWEGAIGALALREEEACIEAKFKRSFKRAESPWLPSPVARAFSRPAFQAANAPPSSLLLLPKLLLRPRGADEDEAAVV
jgi:hypothetical protein